MLTFVWIASILGSLGAYAHYVLRHQPTRVDDAYMFVRYADNLLAGHGYAWNRDGDQTYGCTSVLFLGVIALLRATLSWLAPSQILACASAGAGALAVATIAATCGRFSRSSQLKGAYLGWAGVLFPMLLFSPAFRLHAISGMDTTLSLLANSVLVFATLTWVRRGTRLALGAVVGAGLLAYWARPDNLVFVIAFPPLCLGLLAAGPRRREALRFAACVALVLLSDTAFKFWLFGDPLPLSYHAKSSGFYAGYVGASHWNPVGYLFEFAVLALPFVLAGVAAVSVRSLGLLVAFLLPVGITIGTYFTITQIMGYGARFYFPSLAFVAVCAGLVVDLEIESGVNTRSAGDWLMRGGIALLIVLGVGSAGIRQSAMAIYEARFIGTPERIQSSARFATAARRPLRPMSGWEAFVAMGRVVAALPPDTRVAMSEYGWVGAQAPDVHIVDPLGLHDAGFAHAGFSAGAFLRREPELIWFPHGDYSGIVSSILDERQFWEDYDYYPGAYLFGLAVRRQSPHRDAVLAAVRRSWRESYRNAPMKEYRAIREPPAPGP